MQERLEPAKLTYNDWSGTAAAENSILKDSVDLQELSGLKGAGWVILAINVYGFSHGEPTKWDVEILAIDKLEHNLHTGDDWQRLQDERGALPVRAVQLNGVDFDTVCQAMKVVQIQFRSRDVGELDIVERTEHTPQLS